MRRSLLCIGVVLAAALTAAAQPADWDTVDIIKHSTYQSVDVNGFSTYDDTFPVRLRGVVLNNPEDWLSTAYQNPPVFLGAQWEIFVQAVNLDTTAYDPDPGSTFDDFGGTATFMAQNYLAVGGTDSYDATAWQQELDRVNHAGGIPGTDPMIRAGDLIEVRARGGLDFGGKKNVNEEHRTETSKDFEIVLLEKGFGLPTPASVTISDLKDSGDGFIFDPTRQAGAEHYQASLVTLTGVEIVDPAGWGSDANLTVTDASGRTIPIYLGLNSSFDGVAAPVGPLDITGIINQVDVGPGPQTEGYSLLVMNADDIVQVPEPGVAIMLGLVGLLLAGRRREARRV